MLAWPIESRELGRLDARLFGPEAGPPSRWPHWLKVAIEEFGRACGDQEG